MTRIVAGSARGRHLRVPPTGTRPTTDRVREAVFSALQSRLDLTDLRVLDLYAGSGGFGLEALSRGAGTALFVESDRRAAAVLRTNISALNFPNAKIHIGQVHRLLRNPPKEPFDLVFLDPPYDLPTAELTRDLELLSTHSWLTPAATVLCERSHRSSETPWPPSFSPQSARRYGETRIESACFEPEAMADHQP